MSRSEKLTGLSLADQVPVGLVGLGHGGVHWVAAAFYVFLPYLARDLGLTYTQAGLLVTLFHATSVLTNFGSGVLVDLTGRRVLHQVVSLVASAAALAGFALSGEFAWLALMVIVIGAANNLWHPAAISYLSGRFPTNRGYALSIHALGANLGDAVAPLAAGALLLTLDWRGASGMVAAPVAAAAVVLAIGLRGGGGPAAGAGVSFADYLGGMASLLRDRAVLGLSVMAGLRTMTQNGLLMFLPLYLTDVLGLGPLWMGLALSLMQGGGVVAAPIAGVWSDRIGRRPIVLAGLGLSTLLIAGLTLVGGEVPFVAGIALLGFALFAVRPVVHSWMMDLTPPHLGGSATSLMFGVQSGFSALAPVIGGFIADAHGLPAVFYFLAATMLAANLAAVTLIRRA